DQDPESKPAEPMALRQPPGDLQVTPGPPQQGGVAGGPPRGDQDPRGGAAARARPAAPSRAGSPVARPWATRIRAGVTPAASTAAAPNLSRSASAAGSTRGGPATAVRPRGAGASPLE